MHAKNDITHRTSAVSLLDATSPDDVSISSGPRVSRRTQHNLVSMAGEPSGSRAPLVTRPSPSSSLVSEQYQYQHQHQQQNQQQNQRQQVGVGETKIDDSERIAMHSFVKRRSIFERNNDATSQAAGNESSTTSLSSLDAILSQSPPLYQTAETSFSAIADNVVNNKVQIFSNQPNTSSNSSSTSSTNINNSTKIQPRNGFFEIAWLNFSYSVGPNIFEDPKWGKINSIFHKERSKIVKSISGCVTSGQMVALMGPSGAGKTCLLECIAGVRQVGTGGSMWLRGRKRAQLAIVPQYDDFMRQFSVEETIVYGSRMKNPVGADHRAIARLAIDQLGLQVCRKNNIQQCSGGQRKRVAIAQELVSRPNVLILDEPTSGLDSSCCFQTMRVLRNVIDASVDSAEPMAIIMTIHQPSAKVFTMFDGVFLLSKTGQTAYSGPPTELLETIRLVTGLECPKYSNPSDYMIEIVAHDYGDTPVDKLIAFETAKARKFVANYEQKVFGKSCDYSAATGAESNKEGGRGAFTTINTTLKASKSGSIFALRKQICMNNGFIENHTDQASNEKLNAINSFLCNFKAIPLREAISNSHLKHPFLWHTWMHMHRSFLGSVRDPMLNNMRIFVHLVFASIVVIMYGKLSGEAKGCPPVIGLPSEITDPNSENVIDLVDNIGYLFMCIMMITYVSLMSTVLTFPLDIKTVGREYKNGWYGTVSYFIGKSIADVPFIIVYPVMYTQITWYCTHQAPDAFWRYLSFTGLIILNAMNSQSFGLILGAIFMNSITAATFLGPIFTIPWYLFTGFTKRIHLLNEPYKTISEYLFTRSVFEGLLDTAYGHDRCNCSAYLEEYHKLRYEEAVRLGEMISAETLSSLDYYDNLETVTDGATAFVDQQQTSLFKKTFDAATTAFTNEEISLESIMEQTNDKANSLFSFGLDFEPSCPSDYKSFVIKTFRLEKDTLHNAFVKTIVILLVARLVTYILVAWKIRTRHTT